MAEITITPDQVREVITTSLDDQTIQSCIDSAMALYRNFMFNVLVADDLQTEIKKYLAAHFVSIKDPGPTAVEEKIGDASIKYATAKDQLTNNGLRGSKWGLTAIMLDPSGTLANLGSFSPRWISL